MSKKREIYLQQNIHYIKSLFIIKNKFLDDKVHSGVAPKINAALGVNTRRLTDAKHFLTCEHFLI